jgi:hypothetical protein
MPAPTPLSAVHLAAWQTLVQRLDLAVQNDPSLVPARDVLARPVELLLLMAADAPAALGDEVLIADRLRTLLYLALPYAAVVAQAERLVAPGDDAPTSDSTVSEEAVLLSSLPEPEPYQSGVIDLGALPVLALAAARVGPAAMLPVFVRALHGLALAASAAEVLGRLAPELPDEDALRVIMHTLHLLESVATALRMPFLRTFAFDPVERGRWQALAGLFARERLARVIGDAPSWDAAHARDIQALVPLAPPVGGELEVSGLFDVFDEAGSLPPGTLFVFAASGSPPIGVAEVVPVPASEERQAFRVRVPEGAVPGWVGFSSEPDILLSNQFRAGVRERLKAEYANEESLATTVVPVAVIPDLGRADPARPGGLLSLPPRLAHNRFFGGTPRLVEARVDPAVVEPGAPLTLTWLSSGADDVLQLPSGASLPPSGNLLLTAPRTEGVFPLALQAVRNVEGGRVEGEVQRLDPIVRRPVRIAAVEVRQDGRREPLFSGRALQVSVTLDPPTSVAAARLRLEPRCAEAGDFVAPDAGSPSRPGLRFGVPARCVRDGLVLEVELLAPDSRVLETRSVGPLEIVPPRPGTVVLFRPALLEPGAEALTSEAARSLLEAASAPLGLVLDVVELPWADDPLAVLIQPPLSARDPSASLLIEALARRALLTPGLEHALWHALLPGTAASSSASSAASRAVAFSDAAALPALLEGVWPLTNAPSAAERSASGPPAAPQEVLRLWATVRAGDVLESDVVAELRSVGKGGAVPSDWLALTRDARGREIARVAVSLVRLDLSHYVEALLPAGAEVAAVELFSGRQRVLRIPRPQGKLQLDTAELREEPTPDVRWDAGHSGGVKLRIALAARINGWVTPVSSLEACGDHDRVWLDRLGRADGLVLQAADGWSQQAFDLGGERPDQPRLALRRLVDGRWFAEAPSGWDLAWALDGQRLAEQGRILRVDDGAEGLLSVEARGPQGELRVDARRLSDELA